ncbi:MAG: chemotaxis protein CheB [Planctomycetaceae bacterium]|nr:PAS domain-containing protein [Planctomycetaceae bacterium]
MKQECDKKQGPAETATPIIVGIGASAGGLEAMQEFFTAMPADSGLAFVVVQHLDPSHESRMAEILAKSTSMNVTQARDKMRIQADTVYTNPPGKVLCLRHGQFEIDPAAQRGHVEAAIDSFLTALARDQGARSVAIILSGSSGADGPQGVRAVRGAGGMCMAQDPASARFAPMPQAVIDTGLADYVLPPNQMPAALLQFVEHSHGLGAGGGTELPPEQDVDRVEDILKILHSGAGSDYRHYKRTTVLRRIQRRMGLRQVRDMARYAALLRTDAEEVIHLAQDMLIGVSAFFRDTEAWEELAGEVIGPLVAAKEEDGPLRAWVVGCATGEEAYSLGMLLLEARQAAGKACPVQIFATDIDDASLESARVGMYPLSIAGDVSPQRLQSFFTRQGQSYRVSKTLRDAVVFSHHNVLTDPPFSRLDLVTCRNLLIYLEPPAQRKVLSVFSFALNVGAHLMLGKSEGVAGMENLFDPTSRGNRIYRLTRSNRQVGGDLPPYFNGQKRGVAEREPVRPAAAILSQANLDAVLRHFDASMVLVEPEGKILYFHGRMEKYLGHPEGPASLNILDMTPSGIFSAKLRRAMSRAHGQDETVRLDHVPLPRDETPLVNLTIVPVPTSIGGGKMLAIIFEPAHRPRGGRQGAAPTTEDEALVAQLEAEVKALRGELRTHTEDYDAANEELKAANEEMMSMNEELQAANEELESSKEELQSVNEELNTVNSQLNDKVGELTGANNDLANLLGATEIATIFLDGRLNIRRFTTRATELLNVIDSDIGRPLSHLTGNIDGGNLAADAQGVLKSLSPLEKEVQARDGRWYTMRILPFRTLDDRIDGVVITYAEVSRLKSVERQLLFETAYSQSVVETVRHPLLVLDKQLRVMRANRAFYETFQVQPEQTTDRLVYELGNGQWNIPQLRKLIEEVLSKESGFQDFRVEHEFPDIGRKIMLISGQHIPPPPDMPQRLLLTIEDITQRESDSQSLNDLNASLAERTSLAEQRAGQLRTLAAELAHTEQRERERLARLLHDNLQQLLVGAKFQLGAVRPKVQDARVGKALDAIESLLTQSLDTSRSLTAELSPTILYEAGLHAALPWLARQMHATQGLSVETHMNAAVEMDEEGIAVLLFAAVRELLLNVLKHAGVNEAEVTLDHVQDDLVRVTVSDIGSGFDPTKVQADQGTGSGLGLFGLQQRLEHVGGSCRIDSAPGQGTRVTLTAKLGPPRRESGRPIVAAHELEAAAAPQAQDGQIRVLLVDDHAIVRQGLAGILNHERDIKVVAEASSGEEAIEQALRHRPDVIIMDISMPGMSGIEATGKIVAEQPAARIIGLSMYAQDDRFAEMRQQGAVAYVCKGAPSDDLLAAIRAAAGT